MIFRILILIVVLISISCCDMSRKVLTSYYQESTSECIDSNDTAESNLSWLVLTVSDKAPYLNPLLDCDLCVVILKNVNSFLNLHFFLFLLIY